MHVWKGGLERVKAFLRAGDELVLRIVINLHVPCLRPAAVVVSRDQPSEDVLVRRDQILQRGAQALHMNMDGVLLLWLELRRLPTRSGELRPEV